jgi:hypothetical protein
MATTPVAPSAPAAAAPSAAPTPAPVSTPVSTPVATPSAPVATPASPVATPASPAAPSTASLPPNPKDFRGDQIAEFRQARAKYSAEHPEWNGETPVEATDAPKTAAEAEAAVKKDAQPEAGKTEEAAKAETQPELKAEPGTDPLAEEPSLTPQALTELLGANQALNDALAADPKAKGALYKMARENAELKPFADVFPDIESAKFAATTANEFVSLRAKFETATNPEQMATAFESFVDQFKIVDEKGQPVLNADGTPKLGDDYYAFMDHTIGRYIDGSIADIEKRIAGNQYPNEEAKEADENKLLAYKFIKDESANTAEPAGLDLSGLSPEAREAFQKREADLKAREDALNGKQQGQSKQDQEKARTEHHQQYLRQTGQRIKGVFDATTKELREAGVLIPSFLLDSPDGKTAPQFVSRVIDQFKATTRADAKILRDRINLEKLPPTPENLARRVEYEDKLYQRMLPKLIKSELRNVSAKLKADIESQTKKPGGNVSVEPKASGAAPTPQAWTQESSMEQAKKNVAEQTKGKFVDPGERNAMVLAEARRLRNQRTV